MLGEVIVLVWWWKKDKQCLDWNDWNSFKAGWKCDGTAGWLVLLLLVHLGFDNARQLTVAPKLCASCNLVSFFFNKNPAFNPGLSAFFFHSSFFHFSGTFPFLTVTPIFRWILSILSAWKGIFIEINSPQQFGLGCYPFRNVHPFMTTIFMVFCTVVQHI